MKHASVSAHIQIVGWNHRHVLRACLASCAKQTLLPTVVYIDNHSQDGSVDMVRAEFPWVRIVENTTNRGYAGGHNDGFRMFPTSEYVVVLNPDLVLEPHFVERLLEPLLAQSRVAVAVPLLLRPQERTTQRIDAYGTVLTKSLRAVDQYSEELLSAHPDGQLSDPWGFTGAAVAFRRSALTAVEENKQIFDEDLFSYREDVDLSWRLRRAGFLFHGVPRARAEHMRTAKSGAQKSAHIQGLSTVNYLLVLIKDVPLFLLLGRLPFVLGEVFLRKLQLLCTPSLWPAIPRLLRLTPVFLRKRILGSKEKTLL